MCDFVDLGFVVEAEPWSLKSHLLPSKIGGKPAWLSLNPLPNSEELKCRNCKEPCIFLLQLYSPIEGDNSSFHRSIFIFICRNIECHNCSNSDGAVIVFRSSLPRVNPFYPFEPPNYENNCETSKHPSAADYNKLCVVCGCIGSQKCSECHRTFYCSKEHQVYHWKAGHKALCKTAGDTLIPSKLLFPEFGFKMEADNDDSFDEDDDDSEAEVNIVNPISEIKAISDTSKAEETESSNVADSNSESCDDDVSGDKRDFKEIVERLDTDCTMQELKRIQCNSSNNIIPYFLKNKPVIKYAREGTLVLNEDGNLVVYSKENHQIIQNKEEKAVESKIPKCENCNSERVFEFLILPHLLSVLDCNELKKVVGWVAVFTCKRNCSTFKDEKDKIIDNMYAYRKEFSWKQKK